MSTAKLADLLKNLNAAQFRQFKNIDNVIDLRRLSNISDISDDIFNKFKRTIKDAPDLTSFKKKLDDEILFNTGVAARNTPTDTLIKASNNAVDTVEDISKKTKLTGSERKQFLEANNMTENDVIKLKTMDAKDAWFAVSGERVDKLTAVEIRRNLLKQLGEWTDWDTPDGFLDMVKRNKKLMTFTIGTGALAITGLGILAYSLTKAEEINNTDYTIDSIKDDNGTTIVTYTPNHIFTPDDKVTIKDSNSSPHIDGRHNIIDPSNGQFILDQIITSEGTQGEMKVKTSPGNIAKVILKDIADIPVGAAEGILNSILGTLGLPNLGEYADIISIGCVVCCLSICLLISVLLAIKMSS